MIVTYFNNTKPVNFIFLSLFLAFIIGFSLYDKEIIFSLVPILNITFVLLAFIVFYFSSNDKVVSSKNDFGILFYVLLASIFINAFLDLNKTISFFFILLGVQQLYSLQHKDVLAKEKLFNNGLFFGIASFFYPLSFLFLLVTFAANFIFNKISWRMFIIPIIGFITPIFFIFIIDNLFNLNLLSGFLFSIQLENTVFFTSLIHYFIIALILIITLLSIFKITTNLNSKLFFYKQYHILILLFLIISLFLMFFTPNKDGSEMIFIIYPLSVLFANYTSLIQKKGIANFIIFSLLFVLVLKNVIV